jgi:membrane protein implicated in regulation of membrane protease activity
MLALYVGTLVLGGSLIAASAFGVGKDVDAHDVDGSHDIAHGADVAAILGLFASLRFWTFAMACFGATGIVTELAGLPTVIGLPIAALVGVFLGLGAALVFRTLAVDTVDSSIDARTLAGREAEVLLAVAPGAVGKLRVEHQGQLLDMPCRAPGEAHLARGRRVMIVAVKGGVAEVTPLADSTPAAQPTPPPES